MKKVMFTLAEPQIAFIRAEAERLGISMSELLRRWIAQQQDASEAKERERRARKRESGR